MSFVIVNKCCASNVEGEYPQIEIAEQELRNVVSTLTDAEQPRYFINEESLNKISSYLHAQFSEMGYSPSYQGFTIRKRLYRNVIAHLGPEKGPRIVLGAHYDSCGPMPGADDNASGVAGLMAVARLLKQYEPQLKTRVDLVAYTLEEPPFFGTKNMGSYIHAQSLRKQNVDVAAMISLDAIGYYSDEKGSQKYPSIILQLMYPDTGNFISVISNISNRSLGNDFHAHMGHAATPVESLAAPAWVPGVDYSDHRNYWEFDYPAIMVTDTAHLRNPNYHQPTDTIDTLDFRRMKETVRGVFYGVYNLAIQKH